MNLQTPAKSVGRVLDDQHEPIGNSRTSQIGSPMRRGKQIPRPALKDTSGLAAAGDKLGSELAAKGLKRFGFTTKPAIVAVEAAVVMRVSCGAAVDGVQLTTLKEMARCEKSDLAQSRAVPTNSGQLKEKVVSAKDIKAIKKLVLKGFDEDDEKIFIGTQGGSVL